MNRLHVYRAAEGKGIAIMPNASYHEAQMRFTREAWARPESTYNTSFEIEDWRVDVNPRQLPTDDLSRELSEF